jgi:hypothetical protein
VGSKAYLDEAAKLLLITQYFGQLEICTIPGVYSVSNRNEYQKHKLNNVSGE